MISTDLSNVVSKVLYIEYACVRTCTCVYVHMSVCEPVQVKLWMHKCDAFVSEHASIMRMFFTCVREFSVRVGVKQDH